MAWIETHQSLRDHPKLLQLARDLRICRAQAIGHLQLLWLWALDYAPTGDLSALEPAAVSAACDWQGDPAALMKALLRPAPPMQTAWIDPDGKIHDWEEYAGRLIDQRTRDKERKRVRRTSGGHPADGGRTADVPNQPNQPNQPDQHNQDPGGIGPAIASGPQPPPDVSPPDPSAATASPCSPAPPSATNRAFHPPTVAEVRAYCLERKNGIDPEAFVAHYASNGWRVGKNAMRCWRSAVITWEKFRTNGGIYHDRDQAGRRHALGKHLSGPAAREAGKFARLEKSRQGEVPVGGSSGVPGSDVG